MKQLQFPIILSIVAAVLTLGLKFLSWWLTDSVGLLSDAMESLVNLFAALTAFFTLRFASRPVDRTHAYGHEKIEFFSSGLEGTLIVIAAIAIIVSAIQRLIAPVKLESLGIGTGLSAVAAAINFGVAWMLLRVGKRHHSIVLEADGHHLMTDVLTSVGVVFGVGLVLLTKWDWPDPTVAILVAINIVWTGYKLIRRSFNGLMDHALTDEEQAQLRSIITERMEPGTTFHALRTRRGGTRRFADCHLLVPGDWSVRRGHDLAEKIERGIREMMPGLELTLHIEPIESQTSWEDSEMLRVERAEHDR
jgi:cation diffusion facilitator family transporter